MEIGVLKIRVEAWRRDKGRRCFDVQHKKKSGEESLELSEKFSNYY